MAAPPNTYDSIANLNLGNIPQVDDEELYRELLDLHDAIEALVTHSDAIDVIFTAYIAKQRNVTKVTGDYTPLVGDSLILVDITSGNITITLPTGAAFDGYRFEIKAVADSLPCPYSCLIVGDSSTPIDSDAEGITIDAFEAVPVKYDNDTTSYYIHN